MHGLLETLRGVLGLGAESKDLTFLQISLRGVIVLVVSLAILRCGSKRTLARKTPFDHCPAHHYRFRPGARHQWVRAVFRDPRRKFFVVVMTHRLLGSVACRWHALGALIKGRPNVILQDGKLNRTAMRQHHISDHDFDEDMRLRAQIDDKAKLKLARVERSGDISFIKAKED